jgi:hypothetical protein
MKKNVGGQDRFFRFGMGFLSLMILFATDDTAIRLVFGLVAIFGLWTAATGYCPINARLGLDTTQTKDR